MALISVLTLILTKLGLAGAEPGVTNPISVNCGPYVECINHYANVLPYHFHRNLTTTEMATTLGDTTINGSVLENIRSKGFLVYDRQRGHEILGSEPSYQYMFQVSNDVHEAPVYVPCQNKLYFSKLAPGYLPQLVIDLNENPPILSEFLAHSPVYAPNGGRLIDGKIIWSTGGGNRSIDNTSQRPSLRAMDPDTKETTYLLNNYFGYYFNNIDDLEMNPNTRDIWFTDPQYAWFNGLTETPPQLPTAAYRYNRTSGAVFVVEDTLRQPNGITFSPDGSIVYISDTGAVNGPVRSDYYPGSTYHATEPRAIYAFDVSEDGTRASNKRPIYLTAADIPDGLKVAANGYLVTANGRGVDVLDQNGQLLVTVQTNYTVNNFGWAGADLNTLWLVGQGGVSKVDWNLTGPPLN